MKYHSLLIRNKKTQGIYGAFNNAFLFDTRITGNHNSGHEFRAGQRGNGVIGRGLLPQERWALLEYLKVLGGPLEQQLP